MPSWYAGKQDILGTGGIFHYEQAKELSKYHEVAIFYLFDRSIKQDFSEELERGILTYRSKFIQRERVRNRIRIYRAFKKIVQEFQPDIVHAHVANEAGRYAALWCSVFKIPLVVTEHSTVEISGVGKGIAHLYADFVYKRTKGNFCVSEDLQKKLSSIFPTCTFQTMYNGIIIPEQISTQANYRKEDCYNIGFVAALYDKEIKGLQYLLPAIKKVGLEKKIMLHIVGGGEYKSYFENMVEELQLSENVVFYGMCAKEKVFQIVSQMDFLISASLVESFGCSIAEAMLVGKPVLATRCGGPEGFVNDKTGILVEKGSVHALQNGILDMINSLQKFDEQYIKNYAIKNFDNRIICKKYSDIYTRICQLE